MNAGIRSLRTVALLAAALLIGVPLVGAQDPGPGGAGGEGETRPIPERELKAWGEKQREKVASGEAEADEDPMVLFQKIIEDMGEVEDVLSRGSAGKAVPVEDEVIRRLEELLGRTDQNCEAVVKDIIRLIEMAKQAESQSQQQQQQQKQRQQRRQQRKQSSPQNSQGQQQQTQQNDQSSSPATSEYEAQGDPTVRERQGRVGTDAGKWGDLPPKARDALNQQDEDGFPEEYRDELAEYFKRLLEGGR